MGLAVGLALALLLVPQGGERGAETRALLEELAAPDPERARAALEELFGRPDAPRAALDGLAAAPAAARRARARLAAEAPPTAGAAALLAPAAALLVDPDPAVRAELLRLLARADLVAPDPAASEARVAGLLERAALDPDPELRARALEGLGAVPEPGALEALDRAIDRLPAAAAARAAALLAGTPRGAERVLERVRAAFRRPRPTAPEPAAPDAGGTRAEPLAVLLEAYGGLLADRPGGAGTAAERAPLVAGLEHPAEPVRRGALAGLEGLLERLRARGEPDRAERVLAGLAQSGLDPRLARLERLRLALAERADPSGALADARELARARGGARDPALGLDPAGIEGGGPAERDALWRRRGVYLEGVVELALDRPAGALERLAEAAERVELALAARGDLRHAAAEPGHVAALEERALVELARLVALLAAGSDAAAPAVRERARAVHALALEAQAAAIAADLGDAASLSALLDASLSPLALALGGRRNAHWPLARRIALRTELGRALAAVAPEELPGFRPRADALEPPLADPRRTELLLRVHEERLRAVARERDRVSGVLRGRFGDLAADPELLERSRLLWLEYERLRTERARWDGARAAAAPAGRAEAERALLDQRLPSALCLDVARDLRDAGRGAEARELCARAQADLEASGAVHRTVPGLLFAAELAMTTGGTWTDESEPEAAERELVAAVERLEDLERLLAERGAASALARVRRMRSSALVSLAVNANVKLGRPDEALRWFEEAYALRQDDFMRVLLACYRARSGRADEARRLLREVVPAPALYYNLACTYALLGEPRPALEYLERELAENYPEPAARERQVAWAREDPDLASLRDDPRFRALVGPAEQR